MTDIVTTSDIFPMPPNHENTKSHQKEFKPVPQELDGIGKKIVHAAVEDKVICEIKAVDLINPLWEAQLISHLKLASKRLGYLINFNVVNIGNGIKRFAK